MYNVRKIGKTVANSKPQLMRTIIWHLIDASFFMHWHVRRTLRCTDRQNGLVWCTFTTEAASMLYKYRSLVECDSFASYVSCISCTNRRKPISHDRYNKIKNSHRVHISLQHCRRRMWFNNEKKDMMSLLRYSGRRFQMHKYPILRRHSRSCLLLQYFLPDFNILSESSINVS